MRDTYYKTIAAFTTYALFLSEESQAGSGATFSDVADNIVDSSSSLPNLISTVAYVGGTALSVAGVFKLKQHVDTPGQHPLKDGLGRLGAGGGLLAFPYLTEAMTNTMSAGSTDKITPDKLKLDAVNFSGG